MIFPIITEPHFQSVIFNNVGIEIYNNSKNRTHTRQDMFNILLLSGYIKYISEHVLWYRAT